MYKTKLQQLCHQKRWGLPKYSSMKDGPDHLPSFKASVSVNGVTFDCPGPCHSSKEAHNQCAMVAFLHFASSPPSTSPPELDGLYKSQLQNYARRKNLGSPVFTIKHEGPPHATRFKAMIKVDGKSFESPAFYNTLEEAEQAAARVALMSLSLDSFCKGDSGLYKNLLEELSQREGFCKPTYMTINSGSPHMPTFFSTVELEGKKFHGKAGKSKKEAEQDAAKVAYIALKNCGFNGNAAFSSSDVIENATVKPIHSLDTQKSKQNLNLKRPFPSSFPKSDDEFQELELDDILFTKLKLISNEKSNPSFLLPPEKDTMNNKSMTSEPVSGSSTKECPSSPLPDLDLSSLSISESNKSKTPDSYLLCNRVRVYTSYPEIAFPEGTTVLPISDNGWVPVSLEFPNEYGR